VAAVIAAQDALAVSPGNLVLILPVAHIRIHVFPPSSKAACGRVFLWNGISPPSI
jgi:hypothetical protein